jgi:recombination protein RecT
MTEQTQTKDLAPRQPTQMDLIKNYVLSPEVKERFADMMGTSGIYYLNQVMILVANSDDLQKCTPKSILISAMRAASLKLSIDPSSGQAWIIPYKGQATFQLGYRGVYELAQRTNLYRFINDFEVFEGEEVTQDRMTGMHQVNGRRTGDKVIGRMLYFKLTNGFEKTFYMTLKEIDTHAKHYSQAYNSPRSKWNDPYERPKMERKTLIVNGLRKWGRFNQNDLDTIDAIESEQGFIDRAGELPEPGTTTPLPESVKQSEPEIMKSLGYEEEPVKAPKVEMKQYPAPEPEQPKQAPSPVIENSLPWARSMQTPDGTPFNLLLPDQLTAVTVGNGNTTQDMRVAATMLLAEMDKAQEQPAQ